MLLHLHATLHLALLTATHRAYHNAQPQPKRTKRSDTHITSYAPSLDAAPAADKIVVATVAQATDGGYLCDIGAKKPAFLPSYETWLLPNVSTSKPVGQGWEQLEPGEVYEAIVLGVNGADVNISIARAQRVLAWERAAQMAQLDATVFATVLRLSDAGAHVAIENLPAFVPWSHWHLTREESTPAGRAALVGSPLKVKFLEIDRQRDRLIVSHRRWVFQRRMQSMQLGQIVVGEVERLLPYGAIVRLDDGLDGLLHISQVSQLYVENVSDVLSVGDQIPAVVIKLEESDGSISLSTKMLETKPGEILESGEARKGLFERVSSGASAAPVLDLER